ncbi:hypothetical protein [Thermococcus sp.]
MENTDIEAPNRYFTHVFAQPNYYQGKTTDFDGWYNLFKSFRDGHNLNNLFMEMECDGGVKNSETLKEWAYEYVQYANNFPHRAYYYGTDIMNLEIMEDYCHARGKNYIF